MKTKSLLKNVIPQEWSNIWDGPELPNSYLKSLGKKIKGMSNYLKNVDGDNILKKCDINLSEFLHPEAFINALRQKTAREKKIPIDELDIVCEEKKKVPDTFKKTVGLGYMSRGRMQMSSSQSVPFNFVLKFFL